VMECYQMAGSYDFMLRIATKDMEAYHAFLRHKLAVLPHVNTVQTYFVLSETKSETVYPIYGNRIYFTSNSYIPTELSFSIWNNSLTFFVLTASNSTLFATSLSFW